MNLSPLLTTDLSEAIASDHSSVVNAILYALASLKASAHIIGSITDKVKLTVSLKTPNRKALPKSVKIAMRESALSNKIIENHKEAVDALCFALTKIKLNKDQLAELLSITMVLDH
jgi:hypothetical protein